MQKLLSLFKAAGHALETPGDFTPDELHQLKTDMGELLQKLELPNQTGMSVSLDDGETWIPSSGIRVLYQDANEGDDGMEDLLVNLTTEGLILDLSDQESGEVLATACRPIEDLVEMTT